MITFPPEQREKLIAERDSYRKRSAWRRDGKVLSPKAEKLKKEMLKFKPSPAS